MAVSQLEQCSSPNGAKEGDVLQEMTEMHHAQAQPPRRTDSAFRRSGNLCSSGSFFFTARAFFKSCEAGSLADVAASLSAYPALVGASNMNGFTAWHVAARHGHEEVLRLLALTTSEQEAAAAAKRPASAPAPSGSKCVTRYGM